MSDGFSESGLNFVPRKKDRRAGESGGHEGEDRRAATADRRHTENLQYVTFYLSGHYFGVEVLNVQEVLTPQEMTLVPLAPPVVAGLINLRGDIVTAIDLRTRLGFPPRPADRRPMSVVIRTSDGPVNLLVDEIGDVIEVRPDLFEPPPKTLDGPMASVIEGVYKLTDRLLLILDNDAAARVAG